MPSSSTRIDRTEASACLTSLADNAYAHAVLRPVVISAVTMYDGFWRLRMAGNRNGIDAFLEWLDRDDQTAPFRAFAHFARTGNTSDIEAGLEALRRNRESHPWRANTQTWLEACALILQSDADSPARRLLDEFVTGIVAAHKNDEFLKTYYGDDYEHSYGLGTPGHMIQAAIAHHRATGSTVFLECAIQVADDILDRFQGKKYAEHACIEMALVELYRETGNEKYLHGARHFLAPWLRQRPVIGGGEEPWCGRHVVRQPYLCAGGADYLAETGDAAFLDQLNAIWNDMKTGKMHLSGALATSQTHAEQIVDQPFDLSAGVDMLRHGDGQLGFETCEAVGTMYWSWRMLLTTGEVKYADQFERVLYNSFLSHVSLDGTAFDYVCALASDGDDPPRATSSRPRTSCCSPNALRLIASMPGYLFGTSDKGLWVHQYAASRFEGQLADGTAVQVVQKTQYPWSGNITIEVRPEEPATFDLNLRIPGWCRDAIVEVNGVAADVPAPSGTYCRLSRSWTKSDIVTLDLPMPILAIAADQRVNALKDKIALMRGPLVYCFEGVDNPGLDVTNITLVDGIDLQSIDPPEHWDGLYYPCAEVIGFDAVWEDELLDGVMVLRRRSNAVEAITAIPYFDFRNRGSVPMRVWLNHLKTTGENRTNFDSMT